MLLLALLALVPAAATQGNCDLEADSLPRSRAKLPRLREWTVATRPPVTYGGLKIGQDWRGGLLCNDLVPADGCQRWQVEVAVAGGRAGLKSAGSRIWALVVTTTAWGKAVPPDANAPLEMQLGRSRCSFTAMGAGRAGRVEKSGLKVAELTVYYPLRTATLAAMANAGAPKFHLTGATLTVQKEELDELRALVQNAVAPEHLVDWGPWLEEVSTRYKLAPVRVAPDSSKRQPTAGRWLGWLLRDSTTDGHLLTWMAYPVAPGGSGPTLPGDTLGLVRMQQGEIGRAVVRATRYRVAPGARNAAWIMALEPLADLSGQSGPISVVNGRETWVPLKLDSFAARESFAESFGLLLDRQLQTQPAAQRDALKAAARARLDSVASPGFTGPDGDVYVLYLPALDQAGVKRLPSMLFLVDNEGGIRHRMMDAPPPVGLTEEGGASTLWLANGSLRWGGDRWVETR